MTCWASLGQESELPYPIQAICFEYAVDMHGALVATSASANWGYLENPGSYMSERLDDLGAIGSLKLCGDNFCIPEHTSSIIGTSGRMPCNVRWNVLLISISLLPQGFFGSQNASRWRALLACSITIPMHAQLSFRRTGGQIKFHLHTVNQRARVRLYGDTLLTLLQSKTLPECRQDCLRLSRQLDKFT